jgi:uncharacterized protein
MYSPKILIGHLNLYLTEIKNLSENEKKDEFNIIKNYIDFLRKFSENFHITADNIQENLNLIPHREGGFYREFIRTNDQTVIFYLLPNQAVSSWHSLKDTKEEFKLILGEPLIIEKIDVNGDWKSREEVKNNENVIIQKSETGDKFGDWFGAYTNGKYALVTCKCVGPFEFEKFKLADKEDLIKFHQNNPSKKNIINKLSPKDLKGKTNVIRSFFQLFTCCIGVKKNEGEIDDSSTNLLQNNR